MRFIGPGRRTPKRKQHRVQGGQWRGRGVTALSVRLWGKQYPMPL